MMSRQVGTRRFRSKSKNAKLELLARVPLFSACTKGDLGRVASLVDEIDAPKGKVLTRQGEPGWECFVIAEGEAKASVRGRRSTVLGPGSFFGEMALLDGGPRSATVTAETDMHLLVLTSRGFSTLIEEVPVVAQRIMRGLAERLREAESAQTQH
jgi:CRP/FNR family transcriptional regulator, cyclic AMP receptor protein